MLSHCSNKNYPVQGLCCNENHAQRFEPAAHGSSGANAGVNPARLPFARSSHRLRFVAIYHERDRGWSAGSAA
jgi:hypothetical protein